MVEKSRGQETVRFTGEFTNFFIGFVTDVDVVCLSWMNELVHVSCCEEYKFGALCPVHLFRQVMNTLGDSVLCILGFTGFVCSIY